jgi:ubiquinone/menaquinone biosynthesis C-methylase UbiE
MPELKSNVEWKLWGKEDPLWAVATLPGKHKGSATAWTNEEFYAHGASDWKDDLHQWQHYGLTPQSCLEIGCGAGRMTKQLAKTFERVYAVDVSEGMIDRAKSGVDSPNVQFLLIDGVDLPLPNSAVKSVFSTHVFQHLESVEIGFAYFQEIHRVLEIGGTLMVHLPIYRHPYMGRFRSYMPSFYAAYRAINSLAVNMRRRRGKAVMKNTPYSIDELTVALNRIGFKDIEFRIFVMKSNNDPHSFVFATK